MENTLVPLDLLYVREDGRIVRIYEGTVPLDRTILHSGEAVRFGLGGAGGYGCGVRASGGRQLSSFGLS